MIQYFTNAITAHLKASVAAFIGHLPSESHWCPVIIIDVTSARQKGPYLKKRANAGQLHK
jgi:hypothetical protein